MTKAEFAQQVNKNNTPLVSCSLISKEQLQTQRNLLGVVSFDEDLSNVPDNTACINVPMPQCESPSQVEIWQSNEAVQHGQSGNIQYSRTPKILFGCLSIPEGDNLKSTTEEIYLAIFEFLKQQNTTQLLRVWNHFSHINQHGREMERYQEFCVGRFNAFEKFYGQNFQQCIPAASAIGTYSGNIVIYFIASAQSGVYLENPRQVSAYHYPAEYGPCSPSFARASLLEDTNPHILFLSGTASVVGHQSLHVGEIQKQLEETINNIDNLMQHPKILANNYNGSSFSIIKVYLRNQAFLTAEAKNTIKEYFGDQTSVLYLNGDICREDLLLEIEGVNNFF